MTAPVIQKPKLVQSDLCNPKKISAMWPESIPADHSEVVGTIVGMCTGIKVSIQKAKDGLTDEVYLALEGMFEGMPADPERSITQSGICYLSEAFMLPIVNTFGSFDANTNKFTRKADAPQSVRIVTEVLLMKATNPQGYSWALRAVQAPDAIDPLADLKKMLPPRTAQAAIADGTKAAKK